MDFDVGSYRMTLPVNGVVLGPKRFSPTYAVAMTARIGPFDVSAHTSNESLSDWREFVGGTTKYQAPVEEIEVNGIPGLTIPEGRGNTRRLDYVFKAHGRELIAVVAWSDVETTEEERALVKDAIRTLCIRPTPSMPVPPVV